MSQLVLLIAEPCKPVHVSIVKTVNDGKKTGNPRLRRELHPGRILLLLLTALFCAGAAVAGDGYWVGGSGGNWAGTGNWDAADGIASGADSTAWFGFAREAAISPNSTFSVAGAQIIGNLLFTTQVTPASWNFNPGSGGSLTLNATFGPSEITVTSPGLQVSLNILLAGGAGVEKDGPGTLVLSANNTYSGQTLVNGGGLNVSGSIGTGGVTVKNAGLGGTGVINGPVIIGNGGTISIGGSGGPLTINNSLTLLSGSTTAVTLDGQPAVKGLTGITYGGTLLINNLSGAFPLGQSFSIFGSVPASGNFTSIQPPPGPWQRWSFDPATGQITVVSSASQPVFAKASVAGTGLALQVTGGPPGSPCYLIATSDLTQPKSAWKRVGTNVFDMSGNFATTNATGGNGSGQTYLAAFVIPSP